MPETSQRIRPKDSPRVQKDAKNMVNVGVDWMDIRYSFYQRQESNQLTPTALAYQQHFEQARILAPFGIISTERMNPV